MPVCSRARKAASAPMIAHIISSTDEMPADLFVLVRLEIQDDTFLTVVGTQVVRALPVSRRGSPLPRVIAPRRLNLDNLCPQIGQGHRTKGTTEHTRQID